MILQALHDYYERASTQPGAMIAPEGWIDKQVDFWTGMEASRKTVWKHWWKLFGLLLVGGLLTAAGVLVCCVGALVTLPIALGAIMYGYETIFGAGPTPSA